MSADESEAGADRPTCRCGDPMDVEKGLLIDVVRCPNRDGDGCRSEGATLPTEGLLTRLREVLGR